VGLESIQNVRVSKKALNDNQTRNVFIKLVKAKNFVVSKKLLGWKYYKSFNLLTPNGIEHEHDCDLVISFIKFNIHFNLKTEHDFNNFILVCLLKEL
jgi:hypothetical protein